MARGNRLGDGSGAPLRSASRAPHSPQNLVRATIKPHAGQLTTPTGGTDSRFSQPVDSGGALSITASAARRAFENSPASW